ncbi:MAG: lamin tail domain-containing protein [Candidatus Nealsonbacteria bacterium]
MENLSTPPTTFLSSILKAGIILLLIFITLPVKAASPLDVIINEIAWMGTETSYNDEWIELYNNTDLSINLDGWSLKAADGTPEINLTGTIAGKGFYLLERTDDTTLPDIVADQTYTGALNNKGEYLKLLDKQNNLIDEVSCTNGWFAGDNSTKQTMERKNPQLTGNNSKNWQISQNSGGTPKTKNSLKSIETGFLEIVKETEQPKDKKEEETEKEGLAAVGKQVFEEKPGSSDVFLIALALAVFSAITILFLKKKIKKFDLLSKIR